MGIYDYIIVGGGISGLYTGYQLSKTGKRILIVESTNRWGGRIYTKKEKGVQFELGAARINSKHTKVMSLLNELKLKDNLYELSDSINFKVNGPKIKFHNVISEIVDKSSLYTKKYLESINLLQLCIDILGFESAVNFQHKFGYDSEFYHLNAYIALKSFKKDFFNNHSNYYILQSGLSSIIDALIAHLESCDNVKLKLDVLVTDLGKNYIQKGKKKTYGNKIICCVPYYTLRTFSKCKELDFIETISPVPLIRIYAIYPKDKQGKVWFHNLDRTITDNYIRHIIPIDPESGLIMISYTDGHYAEMWNNISKLGNKQLIEHLHKEIKDVLGKSIPKPTYITSYYWSAGVHMWKPGVNVKDTYQKLLKPFEDEHIYLINECYSKHQSWIEGCLDMAYDVLDLLDEKFIREKQTGGKGKGKQVKDKQKSKIYTIQQVLKKRNWIILKVKNQQRIYDVSKWLSKHPGGRQNLREGIQANKYFLDSEKYPKSPTDLFKSIGAHSLGKVMKKMLVQSNEYIKYIGVLKKK